MATDNSTARPVHLDDVVAYFKSCSDCFEELDAIFDVIQEKSPSFGVVKNLALAGKRIASDFANVADCWREEVGDKGVKNNAASEVHHA